jgi:hypothetical protein
MLFQKKTTQIKLFEWLSAVEKLRMDDPHSLRVLRRILKTGGAVLYCGLRLALYANHRFLRKWSALPAIVLVIRLGDDT